MLIQRVVFPIFLVMGIIISHRWSVSADTTLNKFSHSSVTQRTLVIAATSDLHGWLSTTSVFPNESPKGILHLAPIVQQLRNSYPHLILLDAGDTLQGSPSNYFFNYRYVPNSPLPIIRLMNQLRYDAVALGNHDLEPPLHVLQKNMHFSNFPWLAANVVKENGEMLLSPYHIIERNGIRLGVLGLLTPGTAMWVDRSHLAGYVIEDMLDSAKHWGRVLKEEKRVDVLIGLFHSGHNLRYDQYAALNQGVPLPNAAGLIADSLVMFDLIISGHAHRIYPRRQTSILRKFRTPIVSPGFWGAGISVAKLMLQQQEGNWKIHHTEYDFVPADAHVSSEMLATVENDWEEVQHYLQEKTVVSITAIPDKESFYQCGTELSHAVVKILGAEKDWSLLPGRWRWKPFAQEELHQPLKRLHLFRWLPHDNFLVQTQLYGRQIQILLKPYRQQQKGIKSYGAYLAPGGFSVDSPNSLIPQKRYPVWLTNYHWNGGRGMRAEALLHPSQKQRVTSETLRDLVFAFLQNPANELPVVCSQFLEKR